MIRHGLICKSYVQSLTAYDGKIYQWLPAELASERLGENRVYRSALQRAVSKKFELILFCKCHIHITSALWNASLV